jgi:hypothetical protein
VFWFVVPAELIFVLVLDGAVLLGAPVLLGAAALLGAAVPLGAAVLLGVPELLGAVTRVSVLAAVPPCGLTDWEAVGPAALSPAPPLEPAGAFTF